MSSPCGRRGRARTRGTERAADGSRSCASAAVTARSPSQDFPPHGLQLRPHHEHEHREEIERDGRALANPSRLETYLAGEGSEEVGRVDGAAVGENVDDVELAEREDRREEDHDA